ncbi:MAG TPA: hypothetical protein VNO33_17430 [Kofleriaceae bacterium]|nr:hypothetical protein [Kofleriaceae bacterium]
MHTPIRKDSNRSTHLLLAAITAASLGACGARDDDAGEVGSEEEADQIASALEQENGGLTTEDEAPLFDDEDGFAEAELESDTAYEDPMETDPAVTEALAADGAAIYHTAVVWGQLPPDFDAEVAVDWDGTLSVNRGAILIRRVIAFEDATDAVERRSDRRTVAFTSTTRPHMDGFRLTIVDPEPESADPLVLTYNPNEGDVFSATIESLLEGPQSLEVDDTGNRLVAVAVRDPIDACSHGFLRGRWHRVRDGRGRLYGVVSGPEGDPVGHMRGVYGERRNGDKVFFGKYIDRDGRFQGLFGGTYDAGHFRGRWIDRGDPDRGILAGEYRENRRVRGIGGHFLGRWAETACDLRLER